MTNPVRLTKTLIDAARPASKEVRLWDSDVKGFVLRVLPSGRKTFGLKYRVLNRQRWFTIGEYGSPWTLDQARQKAREVSFKATQGEDLQDDKIEKRKALTIADAFDLYLKEGPADRPNKRQSSWTRERLDMQNHIVPLIGHIPLKALKPGDVSRFQADVAAGKTARNVKGGFRTRYIIRGGAGAAARCVAAISAMLSWAVRREFVDRNVAQHVPKLQTRFCARFLNDAEIERLFKTLDDLEASARISRAGADIVRMLVYTGARRREIADLKWSEVDFSRRILLLPPERTKAGGRNRYRAIALSSTAAELLQKRRPEEGPAGVYVFPMPSDDRPIQNLYKVWQRVRTAAGLPDLRLHDLRHTFASTALASGAPLASVGRALGHSSASSTQRYAHLRDETALAVADLVEAAMHANRPSVSPDKR